MVAPDFSLGPGSAVWEKGKKRGKIPLLSPPQITSRFASLAYTFSPNGESGPGFKYDFINRIPLPRSFASFDKRAGREYPWTLVKIAP